MKNLSDSDLDSILARANAATAGPWKSMLEGRDHTSGSSFIMTGGEGARGPDLEFPGISEADQDFIATCRDDVPKLVHEIRQLRLAIAAISDRKPNG